MDTHYHGIMIDNQTRPQDWLCSIPFRHLPQSIRRKMAELLNVPCRTGKDWRDVAHACGYPNSTIRYIPSLKSDHGCNTQTLFEKLDKDQPKFCLDAFYRILHSLGRSDVTKILDGRLHEIYEAHRIAQQTEKMDYYSAQETEQQHYNGCGQPGGCMRPRGVSQQYSFSCPNEHGIAAGRSVHSHVNVSQCAGATHIVVQHPTVPSNMNLKNHPPPHLVYPSHLSGVISAASQQQQLIASQQQQIASQQPYHVTPPPQSSHPSGSYGIPTGSPYMSHDPYASSQLSYVPPSYNNKRSGKALQTVACDPHLQHNAQLGIEEGLSQMTILSASSTDTDMYGAGSNQPGATHGNINTQHIPAPINTEPGMSHLTILSDSTDIYGTGTSQPDATHGNTNTQHIPAPINTEPGMSQLTILSESTLSGIYGTGSNPGSLTRDNINDTQRSHSNPNPTTNSSYSHSPLCEGEQMNLSLTSNYQSNRGDPKMETLSLNLTEHDRSIGENNESSTAYATSSNRDSSIERIEVVPPSAAHSVSRQNRSYEPPNDEQHNVQRNVPRPLVINIPPDLRGPVFATYDLGADGRTKMTLATLMSLFENNKFYFLFDKYKCAVPNGWETTRQESKVYFTVAKFIVVLITPTYKKAVSKEGSPTVIRRGDEVHQTNAKLIYKWIISELRNNNRKRIIPVLAEGASINTDTPEELRRMLAGKQQFYTIPEDNRKLIGALKSADRDIHLSSLPHSATYRSIDSHTTHSV